MNTAKPVDVSIADLPIDDIIAELSLTSKAELWVKAYVVKNGRWPYHTQVSEAVGVSRRTAIRALEILRVGLKW